MIVSRVPEKHEKTSPQLTFTVANFGTKPSGSRTGAVILEFAFIAIVLVFIILGLIEVSRGMMVKEALSNSARIGCRLGANASSANTAVIADITTVLAQHGLSAANATITIQVNGATADVSTAKRGDKITVTVSMSVSQVFWASALFLKKTSTLSESVTMMKQI